MKNFVVLFALSLSLLLCPSKASADTLQLTSVGGASVDGIYIYPYTFNFTSGNTSSTLSMLCLDFNREITFNEKWTVSESAIPTDSSTLSLDYRALALIDYAITTGEAGMSIADLQFADWAIFDPTEVATYSGYTPAAAAIEADALALAANPTLTASGFYSAFTLFSPTSDETGWTDGIPQEFMLYTPSGTLSAPPSIAPTPEPAGLLLLGTGLLGITGLLYRRTKHVTA